LSAASKRSSEPKVVGVATSLGMNESDLPGWFFSVDYELVRLLARQLCQSVILYVRVLLWLIRSLQRAKRLCTKLRSSSLVSSATRNAGAYKITTCIVDHTVVNDLICVVWQF
jgi:hypothetical protein